jgi:hypothetical protein
MHYFICLVMLKDAMIVLSSFPMACAVAPGLHALTEKK